MLLGLPLLAAVVVVAGRVGRTAWFVTWPIVLFTVLGATVSLVGMWVGLERPGLLVAGVLPGLMVAYVLPAAPVTVVAGVLVGLAAFAVGARGIAAGTAMTVGATMVLAVVMQGPAVECRESSVSSNSGPWWVPSPSSSSGSGTGAADGRFLGTTQVGDHHYTYACAEGRLMRFERTSTGTWAGSSVSMSTWDGNDDGDRELGRGWVQLEVDGSLWAHRRPQDARQDDAFLSSPGYYDCRRKPFSISKA